MLVAVVVPSFRTGPNFAATVTRVFCGNCGSAITHLTAAFGDKQVIHTGNFADFASVPIIAECECYLLRFRPRLFLPLSDFAPSSFILFLRIEHFIFSPGSHTFVLTYFPQCSSRTVGLASPPFLELARLRRCPK
jgi:hypothetical protein